MINKWMNVEINEDRPNEIKKKKKSYLFYTSCIKAVNH